MWVRGSLTAGWVAGGAAPEGGKKACLGLAGGCGLKPEFSVWELPGAGPAPGGDVEVVVAVVVEAAAVVAVTCRSWAAKERHTSDTWTKIAVEGAGA